MEFLGEKMVKLMQNGDLISWIYQKRGLLTHARYSKIEHYPTCTKAKIIWVLATNGRVFHELKTAYSVSMFPVMNCWTKWTSNTVIYTSSKIILATHRFSEASKSVEIIYWKWKEEGKPFFNSLSANFSCFFLLFVCENWIKLKWIFSNQLNFYYKNHRAVEIVLKLCNWNARDAIRTIEGKWFDWIQCFCVRKISFQNIFHCHWFADLQKIIWQSINWIK